MTNLLGKLHPEAEKQPALVRWSTKHDKCIGCGTTTTQHWARGYCNKCYPKYIVRKTGDFDRNDKEFYGAFMKNIKQKISAKAKIQKMLPTTISQTLNKDLLKELYHRRQMSLGDIAKQFNCSRAYIYNLCKRSAIIVKSKSQARRDAYFSNKKLRYHPVNDNFFKSWSNEMAYVLGFICADGCISHRLNILTISQKEIEILEKIKKLMQAEQNIVHYSHQDINHLPIGSKAIVEDLLKLGITPKKSLTIKFPCMATEYISHFIRGYFDGDGTICRQGTGWKVSIVSGSKDFIESVKEKFEQFSGVNAQKIYKHNDANAYMLGYYSRDNIIKIFNFFYDEYTLKNELCLIRKYNLFKEAISEFNARMLKEK